MNAKGQNGQDRVHILVVDDDEVIRTSIQEAIQRAGYRCSSVPSADKALETLKNKNADVVITDIRMPGINGFKLTEAVKKQYDVDVIIITGYGDEFSYEEAIEKGASDFIVKPVRLKELVVRLKRVLEERALIAQRRQMEEQLRKLTITDDLTKLHNMRHFYTQLQTEMSRAFRYKGPLSLLLLDVDRFKQYNDTYGHLEGDQVLIKLGEVIRECLRKSDTAYRYGGDEFMVILPETRGSEARKVAERIRTRFPAVYSYRTSGRIDATVSVGVAEYHPGEDLSEFIKRADQAMYEAKRQGGNQSLLAEE
ncbi:MAG: diguanylate cyclase [Deltaproteobacteria bacterium]|nr:diguanylate cyclase [Deltaproteobacteria bacterium]MBW2074813.1 diguanylate cyclase [Deltaproteobacteria bacterium]RLB82916.1 MAG: diguanylate cyclase response regulator [Deltaproteobacteria bacterium]